MSPKQEILADMIRESDDRIAQLRDEIQHEKTFRERLALQLDREGSDKVADATQQAVRPKTNRGSLPAEMVAILRDAGKPMRPVDIASGLEERGFHTKSEKGVYPQVLSTLCRKKNLFHRLAHGIYGLTEWNEEMAERAKAPQSGRTPFRTNGRH